MYKAVICCLNSKYIHSSLAPWCLFSAAKEKCGERIHTEVIEGTINEELSAVAARILEKEPDAAAFCCYIWNIKSVLTLARQLKQSKPKMTIILGGPEVSFNSAELLREHGFVDFVLCGEGEDSFPRLISALESGSAPDESIASMRKNGKITAGAMHMAESTVSPYCDEYFKRLGGRICYIESSRGCPFTCAFCLSGTDRTVRFFPLERVKGEMLRLASSGTKTVKFIDRTFNCKKDRAEEILLFIRENYGGKIPRGVCFHFEIAADILDERLLSVISSMPKGAVQFEAGIQSFNEKTLEAVRRRTDLEKLCKNIKALVSFGNCHIHTDLIAGLPYEDYASFKESFNRAYSLSADMLQLGFLKVLHGSCLETEAKKYGLSYNAEPPYEIISTPWLSETELKFLHRFEDAFERLYNSGRFKETIKYALEKTQKTPFDLFEGFTAFVARQSAERPPLDLFTAWVFEYFGALPNIDKTVLRDKMLTDRMKTNASGVLPKCLFVPDRRLRQIKRCLSVKFPPKKGVKRAVAVLYGTDEVMFCDYEQGADEKSGFSPMIFPLSALLAAGEEPA